MMHSKNRCFITIKAGETVICLDGVAEIAVFNMRDALIRTGRPEKE